MQPKTVFLVYILFIFGSFFAEADATPIARMADALATVSVEASAEIHNPFKNNFQLVEAHDIAMAWSAPAVDDKTPINTDKDFPQTLNLAAATFTMQVSEGSFTGIEQQSFALPASYPLYTSYNAAAFSANLAMVAADINGDGRDELVIASYSSQAGHVEIHTGTGTTSEILKTLKVNREDSIIPKMAISMAVGDFNHDGRDQIALVWTDNHLNVQVISFEGGSAIFGEILQVDKFDNTNFYPQVAATAGQFSEDGVQLAVAWTQNAPQGAAEAALALQVFTFAEKGKLTAQGLLTTVGKTAIAQPLFQSIALAVAGQVSLTHGDLNGNSVDEIIFAWNRVQDDAVTGEIKAVTPVVSTYELSANLMDFSQLAEVEIAQKWAYSYISITVGDFNLDLIDEIVIATAGALISEQAKFFIDIYSYDATTTRLLSRAKYDSDDFVSPQRSNWPAGSFWSLLDIEVADLNGDQRQEIVASWRPSGQTCSTCVSLAVFPVALDITKIDEPVVRTNKQQILGYIAGPNKWIGGHLDIALGDFSGNGVWVGEPKKTHHEKTSQILALINEPPKHQDYWSDSDDAAGEIKTLNVNNNPNSYVLYQNKLSASTNMMLDISRDWSYSDKLESSLGIKKILALKSSIEKTYGNNFDKKYGSIQSLEFGANVFAEMDDYVVSLELGYTVWEYPTYSGQNSNPSKPEGNILVVFPDRPSNSGVIQYTPGTSIGSYYKPGHETANLLSYSSANPIDVVTKAGEGLDAGYVLLNQNKFTLGPGGKADEYVSWSEVKDKTTRIEQAQSITKKQGFNAKFSKGITFGLDQNSESKYTQKQISTLGLTYQEDTSIHLYLASFENGNYSYSVTPWVYWSEYGYLVVDYNVDIPNSVELNGWYESYGQLPDPAFSLPMRFGSNKNYLNFTREISFDTDPQGMPRAIEVTIHNYSLLQQSVEVLVQCYDGDPEKEGALIGDAKTLNLAGAQASIIGSFAWSPRTKDEPHKIYCVIDPEHSLAEIHQWNNTGWTHWPINETQ
ncbi:MAG: hypothetical protein ACI8SJ_001416 [Shewanella sp.]|jgi:hypothetical protein